MTQQLQESQPRWFRELAKQWLISRGHSGYGAVACTLVSAKRRKWIVRKHFIRLSDQHLSTNSLPEMDTSSESPTPAPRGIQTFCFQSSSAPSYTSPEHANTMTYHWFAEKLHVARKLFPQRPHLASPLAFSKLFWGSGSTLASKKAKTLNSYERKCLAHTRQWNTSCV